MTPIRVKTFVKWLAGILICALVLVGAVLFVMADPYYLSAPTDASLIERLQKNRASFVLLRQMMQEDGLYYVSPSKLDKPVSERRKQEYLQLLKSIGNPILRSNGEMTKYSYAGGGLLAIGPGWQKGIQFECQPNVQTVASLDNTNELKVGDFNQRTIDDDWCLIFEIFD